MPTTTNPLRSSHNKRRFWFIRLVAPLFVVLAIALLFTTGIISLNSNEDPKTEANPDPDASPVSPDDSYFVKLALKPDAIAICIDGDAEMFELTGPTMLSHLVEAYSDSAVFLSVRLNRHSHKLSLLNQLHNLATVHLLPETIFPETVHAKTVFSGLSSDALQALLNQLNLAENCLSLINKHETKYGMKFQWIMRSRIDSFWSNKPPSKVLLNPKKYTAPRGSRFGGLNDRWGLGGREAASAAFKKLSVLPDLNTARLVGGNSETTLLHQLKLKNIEFDLINVPFCILSKQSYPYPLTPSTIPVASIGSKGALNGARCRPCEPEAIGDQAVTQLNLLKPFWGNIGNTENVDLCNAMNPWSSDWMKFYTQAAGEKSAEISDYLQKRKRKMCLKDNEALISVTPSFRGPPARILCLLSRLEPPEFLGKKGAEWLTYFNAIDSGSVVYSVGLDHDLSWEEQIFAKTSAQIHLFDATPTGVPAMRSRKDNLTPLFKLHNWCMASIDGNLEFNSMLKWGESDVLYTSLPFPVPPFEFINKVQAFPAKRLRTTMKRLGHKKVDLLKLDLGGTEFSIILEDWILLENPLPVCQLLIRFSENEVGDRGEFLRSRSTDVLKTIGMHLIQCGGVPGSHKCVFLSDSFC